MDPFAAARTKAKEQPTTEKKSKDTIITLPDCAEKIDEFSDISQRIKDMEADKKILQSEITDVCRTEWIKAYIQQSRKPGTLKFKGRDAVVTLVVQDRGGSYAASDDQQNGLKKLLGDKTVDGLMSDQTRYSFNSSMLAKPGVMEAISKCVSQMVEDNILTADEAGDLIKADTFKTIRKGVVDELHSLGRGNLTTMAEILDVLGSTASIYVKP